MAETSASSGQQPKNADDAQAETETETETNIIDLVESSDENEIDDVIFIAETTKKRPPTGNISTELPSDVDVVDLVDDYSPSSKASVFSDCNESGTKNSRKRPRTHTGIAAATRVETINLLDSSDEETETVKGNANCRATKTTTTSIDKFNSKCNGNSPRHHSSSESRIAQHLILEPDDTAILTQGIVETMHVLSVSSGNHCWTCLGSNASGTDPPLLVTTETTNDSNAPAVFASHIQQTDNFSCGYRNFQMMLSALLPRLRESCQHSVFSKIPRRLPPTPIGIPSISRIQAAMEDGWNEGFDPTGADHYNHSISGKSGNSAKIGAMEVVNLCWYHGIDAVVLQFMKCSESRNVLPYFVAAYFSRTAMIPNNFENNNNDAILLAGNVLSEATQLLSSRSLPSIVGSNNRGNRKTISMRSILPLYLQWEGHSVTIVGIEASATSNTEESLPPSLSSQRSFEFLVLDPMKQASSSISSKLPWKKVASKDLQIIVCTERSMLYSERQSCKIGSSSSSRLPPGRVVTAAEGAVQKHLLSSHRR